MLYTFPRGGIDIQSACDIPDEWARRVVEASGWPQDALLLLFLGSSPPLHECGRAVWVGHKAQSKGLEGLWGFGEWDCCVIVTERATDVFDRFPSFVAWILGHELGHALTALRDPSAHAVSIFVQENIRRASNDAVLEWFDLPHEDACDRFGRFVAEKVVGRQQFEAEIRGIAALPDPPMGKERLLRMLRADPISEMPPLIPLLRDFVAPYSDTFRVRWADDQKRGAESYVSQLSPDLLLRLPTVDA